MNETEDLIPTGAAFGPFRAAFEAIIDDLGIVVERVETQRADSFSENARKRNGLRAEPGVRVTWKLTLAEPDAVLDYVIEYEAGATYPTRKAAEAAIEHARAVMKREFASPVAWIDTDWSGSSLLTQVLSNMEGAS